ncbi:MAG: OmpA family protein [Alphaproteobacteria bacterium]|nr:OmpA family protein [Alphaproteobacteria bacterium]
MRNKVLSTGIKISTLSIFFAITGCSEYHKMVLQDTEEKGSEFTKTLAKEYEILGNTEQSIMYDEWSAAYYYHKALKAKEGCPVEPTQLCEWDIEEDKLPELIAARERLVRALEFGGWEVAPKMSAHAQTHFDCWVEQQAEGWQKEDIARCRAEFYIAMADVELMMVGGIEKTLPSDMVFFDLGNAHLNAESRHTVDKVAKVMLGDYKGHLLLVGRTDHLGDEKHNQQLSKQRAMMVKKELVRMGINPHRITIKAAGEAPGPKVDAHNRRVDILFLDYK